MIRKYDELLFEISKTDRSGYRLAPLEIDEKPVDQILDQKFLRKDEIDLPEISEVQAIRHYTNLSHKNYDVDTGFYPLGSCTMKYNPKINEEMASLNGFKNLHPYTPQAQAQGALELMYNLQESLAEIAGMDYMTLQPAAGAHGELTGIMMIRAYHESRGDFKRKNVIVPDAAHGTNPATASMAGYKAVEIPSNEQGMIDMNALKEALNEQTAALMLTNPNTLGIFDENIAEIARLVHEAGGLVYYDGANANAILSKSRPGDMGFDVVHFNLHKTFTTPHGGGGPGSGPVGVKSILKDFLPAPYVVKEGQEYRLEYDIKNSIGRVKDFYGHFGILVRAYTYILTMGRDGLKKVSELAVLNANYLLHLLKDEYALPYEGPYLHEFVLSGAKNNPFKFKTIDVAKRLIDYGYHPPTVYFPLIVNEAMMIEPTETETKETLESFAKVLLQISREAAEDPSLLKEAPHHTPVRRPDETLAARNPILTYQK